MEVCPIYKPIHSIHIHSIKEFMVYQQAITIGMLIAFGLESSAE